MAKMLTVAKPLGKLHGSGRMREEIGRRFIERYFSWWPYLYPDLDDDASEADELAAIEAGEINATSLCYVGTVASERSAQGHPCRAPTSSATGS